MQYRIKINDRNYSSWDIQPRDENLVDKTPFDNKLFHEDTFEIDPNQKDEIHIVTSPTRESKYIAGVLILEKNKTFGRTPNKKRLYYSCIPHDKHLPTFLVPYDIDIGFEKVFPNKYVLFRFDHWLKQEKHPYGILVETIGDVTNLFNYDIYQLYAKNLHRPHKHIQKQIQNHIKIKGIDTCIQEILSDPLRFGTVEDRRETDRNIFSMDPTGCMDRDDAVSIRNLVEGLEPNDNHKYLVSIYIANVAIWIEYFQIYTFLQETNISTIYLQDNVIPMLPTALSEKICSLDQTHDCFAIVMDFEIDILAKTIKTVDTKQCLIRVKRNFDYTSKGLELYPPYKNLLNITQKFFPEMKESHALVAFWMMQMNKEMAKELYRNKTGIFRISSSTKDDQTNIHKDTSKDIFLYIWENAISGKYVMYSDNTIDYSHAIIDVPLYIHFTSPIRRMVDIYNQISWVNIIEKREKSRFANIDIDIDIDKINQDTKKIRKMEKEKVLLNMKDKGISEMEAEILEMDEKKAWIYIYECKSIISCNIKEENKKNRKVKILIYEFERENEFQKKIKVEICKN